MMSLALVAPLVLAQAPWSPPAQTASPNAIQQEAWQLVQLTNQSRAQVGAGPLKWDSALAKAVRQHCLRMATEGQLSHQFAGEPDPGERAAQAGARFSLIEENLALAPTAAEIYEGWMSSPHHRANLLNPQVDSVGVAVVAGRDGLYAVADYELAVPMLTQTQIEARVVGLLSGIITILPDPTLARAACAEDSGVPIPASGPRPRFVMRWIDAPLNQLPQALMAKLASGQYHQASVGSCSPQGEVGFFTAYRIAVLLY